MTDDTPSARADVNPGDKIAGYWLEEQIGQGGMAVVYRAHDERLDRRVALKILAPGLAVDTAFRTRFIRESRAAAAVDHPNIIPVYDAGDAGGFLFIAMRYVHGGDVRALLTADRPVPPARAWNIVAQVAAALDAAHQRDLIHRDVKPANMLLDPGGGTSGSLTGSKSGDTHDHVYLSDFGISKQTLASHLTSTGQFVGTLDYIAPEQIEGRAVDGRSDLYSLGCAAFELLSGVPPFRRDLGLALINAHLSEQPPSLVAMRPELPAHIDRVIGRAMAKSPAVRYDTCTQFATELGQALGLIPGPVSPEQREPAPPKVAAAATQHQPGVLWPAGTPGGFEAATMLSGEQVQQAPQPGGAAGQQAPQPGGAAGQRPPPAAWPAAGQQGWPSGPQGPDGTAQQYPPAGTAVPTAPGGQQPHARRSRGLIIGVALTTLAVAAAAVGIIVALASSHNGSAAPPASSVSPGTAPVSAAKLTPSARRQAIALGNVLSTSVESHGTLQNAVLDIEDNCASLSSNLFTSDVVAIQVADQQRQAEYDQAKNLNTGALANGAALKADLMNALLYSLRADDNYATWAEEEQSGCFVSSSSVAYRAAGSDSTKANAAKLTFANLWNSEAPSYHQPVIAPSDI